MINKVILMGRLTADPELKNTQSGTAYCKFTVAVDRRYADKSTGERQADFINVIAWRQSAEFIAKYFQKGSAIIVEGTLQNNNYEDKDGVKHYTYIVNAEQVSFGASKKESTQNSDTPASTATQNKPTSNDMSYGNLSDFEEILSDGDVPF